MSHYLTVVLTDSGLSEDDIDREVDRLLRPHSNLDDPEKDDFKCDGWIIGGRYDGQIFGAPPEYSLSPSEFQKRYGFDVVKAGSNVRPVAELSDSFHKEIAVVVDPTGKWTCCYDVEFKDSESLAPQNGHRWQMAVRTIFEKWNEKTAVVIDVHY